LDVLELHGGGGPSHKNLPPQQEHSRQPQPTNQTKL
jgi:hypothetical protein